MSTSAPVAETKPRRWPILLVLSLALAIIIIDTTLLNVSLANIIRDLNTDIQSLQWVISGYALTLAALTITGGRLGDLFGRKRMFVLGAIIFAVGSFVTSISQTIPVMLIGEALIEGVGAALMMPATSSLLVANFKGRDRALAFGVWGGIAGAAAALGPIVGGYLTTNYSWRWGFRINIIVAIILVLGSFLIPESQDREEKPSLDWIGVLLSSFGMLSFVFGVIESSTYGWWKAKEVFSLGGLTLDFGSLSVVPVALALGVALLAGFFFWERAVDHRGETPLVSPKLFANRQFTSGALTTAVMSLGQAGLIFSVPVFLQSVRGLDAFHTGLSFLPMSLALLVIAPLGATLSHRIDPKRLIQLGLLVNIVAVFVLRNSFTVDATVWNMAPGLALYGIGMGLVMSQINNLTLSAVSVEEAGEASGVNNTLRQVGSSLGSAIIGAVLLSALTANLVTGIHASSVIPDNLKDRIATSATEQTSNVEFGGGSNVSHSLPTEIVDEITSISHQATVDADKSSLIYAILFAVLGFLVSFQLPKGKDVEKSQSLASGH